MPNGEFALTVHINYEDTDAGGVVYYANYLGYMERARNACLRQLGFPPGRLMRAHSTLFVVLEVKLKYLAPAHLDDELEVTLELVQLRRASLVFRQRVRRRGERDSVLVDGEVRLGALDSDTFKPRRLPGALADALSRWSRGE